MWKTNQQEVEVFRALITTENRETIVTNNAEADEGIKFLTVQEMSNNKITIAQYGAEASGRIEIKLKKNQILNKYDQIVWNDNLYQVDTETTYFRLFNKVQAKWVSKHSLT